MGIYIYKETNGTGLVFQSSTTKPASTAIFNTVNGSVPYSTNFTLLGDFNAVNSVAATHNKDYKTWRDALKTAVADLDNGDVEKGFNLLTADQKKIAAKNNIGTGAQILAAIPDFWQRYANSQEYIIKMRGCGAVRKMRSIKAEAAFWAASKHVEPIPGTILPEAVLSDLQAAMKVNANELTVSLLEMYEAKGLMGIYSGDNVTGVLDYFNETVGSRFENGNGFKTKYQGLSIDFDNGTFDDFVTFIIDIFEKGELDKTT